MKLPWTESRKKLKTYHEIERLIRGYTLMSPQRKAELFDAIVWKIKYGKDLK